MPGYDREILDHMVEGCQIIGNDWRYIYLNDAGLQMSHKTRQELIGCTMMEAYPGIETTLMFRTLAACMKKQVSEKLVNEFVYPDGEKRWFDLTICPIDLGVLILSLDITEQMQGREHVKKLNRIYAVLSDINQAIVRIRDPQQLFEKACQIAVEKGQFLMACIGWIDPSSGQFAWAACAGISSDLSAKMGIDLKADRLDKQHPITKTLLNGQIWVDNQLKSHVNPPAWQKEAVKLNIQSAIAFPLIVLGQIRGVFNLYAREAGFFTDDELSLLSEMAMDLAFAVEFTEKESQRSLAEKAVQESEARYRSLFNNMSEGLAYCRMDYINDKPVDFVYLDVNKKFESLTGLKGVVGKRVSEVIPGIQQDNPELFEVYGRVAQTSQSEKLETYVPGLDLWFYISVYSPEQTYFVAVFEVITERKLAEAQIATLVERFNLAVRAGHLGIWDWDIVNDRLVWDDYMYILYGVKKEDFTGAYDTWLNGIHPEDRKASDEISQRTLENGKEYDTEFRVIWPDGSIHWLKAYGQVIRDRANKPLRMVGVNYDITARKEAEEALRKNAETYRLLTENTQDVIWVLDTDSMFFTYVSPSVQTLRGYTPEEIMAAPVDEDLMLEDRQRRREIIRQAVADIRAGKRKLGEFETLEVEQPCKDGSSVWTEVTTHYYIHPDSGKMELHGVSRDISARRKAEAALRESEARFRSAFESSPAGMALISLETRIIQVNQAFCQILGYEEEEVLGHNIFEFTHPDDLPVSQRARDIIVKGNDSYRLEKRYIRKNGRVIWGDASSARVVDDAGRPLYLVSQLIDITERKQAEEEIRNLNAVLEQRVQERTAELSDLFNNAPCGYHSLDEQGVFVNVNDTELNWLGYTREELLGKKRFVDLVTPEGAIFFEKNFPVLKRRGWIRDLEIDIFCRDGSILPVLVNATAVRAADGRFLMSRTTLTDNSDRIQAEKTRQEAQARLEAAKNELEAANQELEAFTYSVSHDLRAPLRAIDGYARIIQEDYAPKLDADGQHLFYQVRHSTERMDRLITNLLAFSRVSRSELCLEPINMAELAQSSYNEIATPQVVEKMAISIDSLLEARGDAVLIRQVWANLISNAIKYSLPKENPRIEIGSRRQNGQAVFYIRDNGVGFDPQYASKLFGVFQRLHKASEFEGTGLGLAIVQRIVKRHGGSVWAEGTMGEGATFYFSLPLANHPD